MCYEGKLKNYNEKHCVQSKVREREKTRIADSNNNSDENAETDENNDSSAEACVHSRFVLVRGVPDEAPRQKQNIPEWKKRGNDTIAARIEFEKASNDFIECKVKRKNSHAKN